MRVRYIEAVGVIKKNEALNFVLFGGTSYFGTVLKVFKLINRQKSTFLNQKI